MIWNRGTLLRTASWVVVWGLLAALPLLLTNYGLGLVTGWLPLLAAVIGLNLLTGFNGQISVGHGALYGIGAYTTVALVSNQEWPFLAAVVGSAVVCFVVGVLIGLPALRVKGLYLALVTLALAVLFPSLVLRLSDRFSWITDGRVTSPRLVYGVVRNRPVRFLAPSWWSGLSDNEWKYLFFLFVLLVVFVLSRNLIASRVGRAMVAIRDNETAAAVSGVQVARVKVLTFGISSAFAGVGGALLALNAGQISHTNFPLTISLNLLVMMVIGGSGSVAGPLVGVLVVNYSNSLLSDHLDRALQPAIPLLFGGALVLLMLVAPGGVVGLTRRISARLVRKLSARHVSVESEATAPHVHNTQEGS